MNWYERTNLIASFFNTRQLAAHAAGNPEMREKVEHILRTNNITDDASTAMSDIAFTVTPETEEELRKKVNRIESELRAIKSTSPNGSNVPT